MKDLTKLARDLKVLDDHLTSCMKCGFCQAFCPVFDETGQEGDVTRGKISLVESLMYQTLNDPEAVAERLSRCLMCGGCAFSCPSGVKTMDIFLGARAVVNTYIGLPPIKKAIFGTLLTNPKLFNGLMRIGALTQGLFLKKDHSPQDTAVAPMLKGMLGDRHMPMLAKSPLSAAVGKLDTPAGKSGLKVAFFPGCMGDKIYVDMSKACIKVLEHHGVGVYLPENLGCCGTPVLTSGDKKNYAKLVKHDLEVLRQGNFDYILTPCSSCTSSIKEHWKNAEGLSYAERDFARSLAEKAMDINAFLVDVLKITGPENAGKGKAKVTYHESCHLLKGLRVSKQPKALLEMSTNCEFVPMNDADKCCGCGGTFTLSHPDLSESIGQRKRNNIVASGAQVVAVGCPACMMQLSGLLAKNNDAVKVKHTVEVYADSL